jgi:hypothetical protein
LLMNVNSFSLLENLPRNWERRFLKLLLNGSLKISELLRNCNRKDFCKKTRDRRLKYLAPNSYHFFRSTRLGHYLGTMSRKFWDELCFEYRQYKQKVLRGENPVIELSQTGLVPAVTKFYEQRINYVVTDIGGDMTNYSVSLGKIRDKLVSEEFNNVLTERLDSFKEEEPLDEVVVANEDEALVPLKWFEDQNFQPFQAKDLRAQGLIDYYGQKGIAPWILRRSNRGLIKPPEDNADFVASDLYGQKYERLYLYAKGMDPKDPQHYIRIQTVLRRSSTAMSYDHSIDPNEIIFGWDDLSASMYEEALRKSKGKTSFYDDRHPDEWFPYWNSGGKDPSKKKK